MRKALIHQFFKELDRELKKPAEIILTGAAAGSLLGVVRPSVDIDFEIRVRSARRSADRLEVREAVQRAAEKAGVAVNYSENIGHWSMIEYLDYRRTALPHQSLGRLRIKLMAPEYWTIGKMGRFYEVDIRDVLKMIRRRKLKPEALIRLWGRAFRASPLSLDLGNFRHHVTHFIERYGKAAWGREFDRVKAVALFEKACGLRRPARKKIR